MDENNKKFVGSIVDLQDAMAVALAGLPKADRQYLRDAFVKMLDNMPRGMSHNGETLVAVLESLAIKANSQP